MSITELHILLEEVYELPFLLKIEKLFEKEKEYKKSDFYKKYKIPIITLYEKFELSYRGERKLADQLNQVIEETDTELLIQKIEEFLDKMGSSEKLIDLLNSLLEKLDISNLEKLADQFQEGIEKLK